MKNTFYRNLMVGSVSYVLAATAFATPSTSAGVVEKFGGPVPPVAAPADIDKSILQKLHVANQHELDLVDLADEKETSAEVEAFADKLRAAHEAADKRVTDLAIKLKIDLMDADDDKEPSKKEFETTYDTLDALDDVAFDKAFLQVIIQGHEKCLPEITDLQSRASAGEVKKLAGELLPSLQDHLKEAKTLAGGSAPAPAPSPAPAPRPEL